MPALTVKPEHLVEVCRLSARPSTGKNFLSAVSAVDYLGYGEDGGRLLRHRARPRHQRHRQLGRPDDAQPPPESASACVYHLAHVGAGGGPPDRVRLQVALDDGEAVPSVVPRSGQPPTGTSASSTT